MLIEPGIQVNPVKDATATELYVGYFELRKQRDSDAQILSCLLLGQTAHGRQRQGVLFHYQPREARRYASAPSATKSCLMFSTKPGALLDVQYSRALRATRCARYSSNVIPLRRASSP